MFLGLLPECWANCCENRLVYLYLHLSYVVVSILAQRWEDVAAGGGEGGCWRILRIWLTHLMFPAFPDILETVLRNENC